MSDRYDIIVNLKGDVPEDHPLLTRLENESDESDRDDGFFRFNEKKNPDHVFEMLDDAPFSWSVHESEDAENPPMVTVYDHHDGEKQSFSTETFCGLIVLTLKEIDEGRVVDASRADHLMCHPFRLTAA